MYSTAEYQLGKSQATKINIDDEVFDEEEDGECVEIVALTEDLSQTAVQILMDRQKQINPVRYLARNLQCETDDMPAIVTQDKNFLQKSKRPENSLLTQIILHVMPVFEWFPSLTLKTVRADLIAGLTVGVMVIPQGMSYANIAGLAYIYGMYSACMPTFIYAFFGQSRQLAVGPVAMVSLLVEAGLRDKITADMAHSASCKAWFEDANPSTPQNDACPEEYAELAFTVAFAVGLMQLLGYVLKLGFLVNFLGHPVTSGFTSGAAIIIGLSQVKYWLGFDIKKSQFVYVTLGEIFKNLDKTKAMTLVLGIIWLVFLMASKKISQKYSRLKLLGPMGPLISCVVGILLIWLYKPLREDHGVKYVGSIPDGLFPLSITKLKLDKLGDILPTAATACLIGYMESVAIGKSLASKHGYEIDAGQEMLALGISNAIGGCFSCYPVTGSFSRSAVMNSTGGLTQLGGLISAIVMFFTLMFLTPLFYYLPKFALASIVINSIIPLVAYDTARKLWHIKKHDFLLWVVAFLGTMLLGVLLGILIAVGLSLIIVIYESVRPQITILWRIPGTTIYRNVKQESSGAFVPHVFICRIGSSLYFANASFVKDMLLTYTNDLIDVNQTEYLVLEMTSVISVDSTAVHVIEDIVNDFRARGVQVAFAMVGNRVEKTLRKAGMKKLIGEQWFFPTVNDAVQYCLRHQNARMKKNPSFKGGMHALEVGGGAIRVGNEIGFSNELNHGFTTVFVSLVKDCPDIIDEIAEVYHHLHITVERTEIEPLHVNGAKHTYLVKSKRKTKLNDLEIERLREDLVEVVMTRTKLRTATASPCVPSRAKRSSPTASSLSVESGESRERALVLAALDRTPERPDEDLDSDQDARLKHIEEAIIKEANSNNKLKDQLQDQWRRLDVLFEVNGVSAEAAALGKPDNPLIASL